MNRIPKFAFEYLDGGCNEDVNLRKNTDDLRKIELIPKYLKAYAGPSLKTELFGHTYDAPFGIAPVGLQGLMWPNAPEILAKAAADHVTKAAAGDGAVREAVELILKAQNKWKRIVAEYAASN